MNSKELVLTDAQTPTSTQTFISQRVGGCYFENYAKSGDNSFWFATQDQSTPNPFFADRLRIRHDKVSVYTSLQVDGNITLNSTYYAKTSGQLGFRISWTAPATFTTINMTSNTLYGLANITLPTGVWDVRGTLCFYTTTNQTVMMEQYSLAYSTGTEYLNAGTPLFANNFAYRQISTIINVETAPQTVNLYLNILNSFIANTLRLDLTTQQRVRLYAVRIA